MASSQHVELEAAKLLQKLIQDSKDEPVKLATKLYVICQHMRLSGKEQTLPYQVISRAMETVINQHGIDINVLKSSRFPSSGVPQMGGKELTDNSMFASDMPYRSVPSGSWQAASSSQMKEEAYPDSFQTNVLLNDSKTVTTATDMARLNMHIPSRQPVGHCRMDSVELDVHEGPVSQRSSKSSEHENPVSVPVEDTRSLGSQDRLDCVKSDNQTNKQGTKRTNVKRKKADSKVAVDVQSLQSDAQSKGNKSRKRKQMNKGGAQGQFVVKGGDRAKINAAQHTGPSEHISSLSSGASQSYRAKQEGNLNLFSITSNSKLPEEGEVSSGHRILKLQNRANSLDPCVWNQNKYTVPLRISQGSVSGLLEPSPAMNTGATFNENVSEGIKHRAANDTSSSIALPANNPHTTARTNIGTPGAFSSFQVAKMGYPAPAYYDSSLPDTHDLVKMENNFGTSSGNHLFGKVKTGIAVNTGMGFPSYASGNGALDSQYLKSGVMRDGALQFSEKVSVAQGSESHERQNICDIAGKAEAIQQINHGFFAKPKSEARLGIEQKTITETSTTRSMTSKEVGAELLSQGSASDMLFKEQHLRQLRAQCLVFIAFRNNLMPRESHLEIALGGRSIQEGGNADGASRGLNDRGGTDTSLKELCRGSSGILGTQSETTRLPSVLSSGSLMETESSMKDTENVKKKSKIGHKIPDRTGQLSVLKNRSNSKTRPHGITESNSASRMYEGSDSAVPAVQCASDNHCEREGSDAANQHSAQTIQLSSVKVGGTISTGNRNNDDHVKESPVTTMIHQESPSESVDAHLNQSHVISGNCVAGMPLKPDSSMSEANKVSDICHSLLVEEPRPMLIRKEGDCVNHVVHRSKNANIFSTHVSAKEKHLAASDVAISNNNAGSIPANDLRASKCLKYDVQKHVSSEGIRMMTVSRSLKQGDLSTRLEKSIEQEDRNKSVSSDVPGSPSKYTTSEKWIMDQQKRKLAEDQKWAMKQRKAEERITASFNKLKGNVSSSEDISAKTKSVIQLKRLQLLQLQLRLRSDLLNDFFKPITSDMERLKSLKKHRHGRRGKQVEKFEQKMKEERQKRIRERQKEFFGAMEVHKERLEDCFKAKREQWKGFNRFVKDFHKRKERIHREKIERIQREKINLLKANDVEGYLRIVQDAKSDRVKQLLRETEKYLQKLGSKLQDEKAMSMKFEVEMEDGRAVNSVEKNDFANEIDDESDQAEHYLESNEKYYTMAHSFKENINEQPTSLEGGKLREYQMNGLRWLVSLYNNHLNGILADEMGLGKTVQVISLICYLMEEKNDRGPFLVVVPSSVLPGWVSEITFWAPSINKIVYAGPPEERRRLFKERVTHQKFNVLLTTYEYLMNKHDRPKLSKVQWHYIIIDEGHRIKNASCKLNADLKLYQSSHRLLLTGTPLQNNLEELWALLNFLLPNIFNSSEDFSQWFNKPFESNVDNSPDQALLSEEENLLIINRLHQVLRPFVLRRLKHKVENELPEKIERLVRCEASAYQKLLMRRVEDNLGSIGNTKGRSIHNSVMELRNICNHPYLSQLHSEKVDGLLPVHYLPPLVRLCGKVEMLDRLLPKLKATDHRVLFFSTMTRLLDVMEEYLSWKGYRYLRLDGQTSGNERGALIEEFNSPRSQAFIFLLSIRAGGVGVNLQAADTVIIFDTDWNPQVDLQAQARAHRIGQKKDVLVLRLETVHTIEEQVRASAEHKLGVANQSITAGFFDNNTSAEDRREYLESLLRESKKEEEAPVLDDESLNDLLVRSESEIDIFESVDKQRREEEMAAWQRMIQVETKDRWDSIPIPSRLVTEEDLKPLYKAMTKYEASNEGVKRKGEVRSLDTQHYGRGKRTREIRSYYEEWTEDEFEKMCVTDSPESPVSSEAPKGLCLTTDRSDAKLSDAMTPSKELLTLPSDLLAPSNEPSQPLTQLAPAKRGRGRPKKAAVNVSPPLVARPSLSNLANKWEPEPNKEVFAPLVAVTSAGWPNPSPGKESIGNSQHTTVVGPASQTLTGPSVQPRAGNRKPKPGEKPRGRARKQKPGSSTTGAEVNSGEQKSSERKNTSRANQKAVPSIATKLMEKQKLTNEQDGTCLQIPQTAMLGSEIICDVKSLEGSDGVSAQTTKELAPVSVQSHKEEKSTASLHNSTFVAVPRSDVALTAPTNSAVCDKAIHAELHIGKSGGTIKLQENIKIQKPSDVMSEKTNCESLPIAVLTGQVQTSPIPVATQRTPNTRASVTREKAAAREQRNRSTSTAACERRARFAGLKQAEASKKRGRKGKTAKALIIKEKVERGDTKVGFVTSEMGCSAEDTRSKVLPPGSVPVQMEVLTETLLVSSKYNRQLDLLAVGEKVYDDRGGRSLQHFKDSLSSVVGSSPTKMVAGNNMGQNPLTESVAMKLNPTTDNCKYLPDIPGTVLETGIHPKPGQSKPTVSPSEAVSGVAVLSVGKMPDLSENMFSSSMLGSPETKSAQSMTKVEKQKDLSEGNTTGLSCTKHTGEDCRTGENSTEVFAVKGDVCATSGESHTVCTVSSSHPEQLEVKESVTKTSDDSFRSESIPDSRKAREDDRKEAGSSVTQAVSIHEKTKAHSVNEDENARSLSCSEIYNTQYDAAPLLFAKAKEPAPVGTEMPFQGNSASVPKELYTENATAGACQDSNFTLVKLKQDVDVVDSTIAKASLANAHNLESTGQVIEKSEETFKVLAEDSVSEPTEDISSLVTLTQHYIAEADADVLTDKSGLASAPPQTDSGNCEATEDATEERQIKIVIHGMNEEGSIASSQNLSSTGQVIEKSEENFKIPFEVSVSEPAEGNSSRVTLSQQSVAEANPDVLANKPELLSSLSQSNSGACEAIENMRQEQKNKFVNHGMCEEGLTPVFPVFVRLQKNNEAGECDKAKSSDIQLNDGNVDNVCEASTASEMLDFKSLQKVNGTKECDIAISSDILLDESNADSVRGTSTDTEMVDSCSNPIKVSDVPVRISVLDDCCETSLTANVIGSCSGTTISSEIMSGSVGNYVILNEDANNCNEASNSDLPTLFSFILKQGVDSRCEQPAPVILSKEIFDMGTSSVDASASNTSACVDRPTNFAEVGNDDSNVSLPDSGKPLIAEFDCSNPDAITSGEAQVVETGAVEENIHDSNIGESKNSTSHLPSVDAIIQ